LIDPANGKIILPSNGDDKEDDVAEAYPDEDEANFDSDYYPAVLPSICPKMPALPKIIPPDFSWIAALKDFHTTGKTLEKDDHSFSKQPIEANPHLSRIQRELP